MPLALVGVDRYIAFFHEVSPHAGAVITTLTGSHDKTPAHELGKLVWPLVEQNLAVRRATALKELDAAVGAQKYASTIGEVWRFVHEGRVSTLLVEEHYHQSARVAADGVTLTLVDDPTWPGVVDDAVDEIISMVLEKGGRVVFVDDGALPQHQRIAVILRY